MIEAIRTDVFASWLKKLRDRRAVAQINTRILRLQTGNAGDVEPVGEGVSELRVHLGPGYRVYFGGAATSSSSCWRAAIRAHKHGISKTALRLWRDWKKSNGEGEDSSV